MSASPVDEQIPALAVASKLRARIMEMEDALGIPPNISITQLLLEGLLEDCAQGDYGFIDGAYTFPRGPAWVQSRLDALRFKWAAEDAADCFTSTGHERSPPT